MFVVDSFSTDSTIEKAREYTENIYQHSFKDYPSQRIWSQDNLPIRNDWVLHLDADEKVSSELHEELLNIFDKYSSKVDGFLIVRRTIFLGKWIKFGGHYPVYHLRLFRKNKGKCETRKYDNHYVCEGKVKKIKGDIIDENKTTITDWINRHNRWSSVEVDQVDNSHGSFGLVKEKMFGSPIERRRWQKNRIYYNLPLFFRPFLYFFYRYFIRLGILDGKEGLVFHFLQGFWYRFLIDVKIFEKRIRGDSF